jgi:hypothetical protein
MLGPAEFALLILASYRITRFFVRDSLIGFGEDSGSAMSVRIDAFAYNTDGSDRSWIRGKIGDLLTCVWCLGFWVSAGCYFAFVAATGRLGEFPVAVDVLSVFAIAGGQGFLSSRINA